MRYFILFFLFCNALFSNIGVIKIISGKADIKRGNILTEAKNNTKLKKSDTIISYKNSRLQIIFNDKTIITLGSNTTFSIKEYLFDEEQDKAKASFSITKGIFKAMTGKIGKMAPNKFKLKTRTSTIGIRGTRFMGILEKNKEIIACLEGQISVSTPNETIDVLSGEITEITNDLIPSYPRDISEDDLENFNKKFSIDLQKNIQSVSLNSDLSFNKQEVNAILDQISKIKDDNSKASALHMLEDKLYSDLDRLSNKHKVEFTLYPLSPSNEWGEYSGGLKWGFYTDTNGVLQTNDMKEILLLTPDDTYREGETTTSEEDIKEYIDNRVNAVFKGKSIGYVTYEGGYSDILINENNNVLVQFDFGSNSIVGEINFDAYTPNTTNLKEWRVYFSSSGELLVSTSGYEIVNIADKDKLLIVPSKFYYNRFYQNNANQISSYFRFVDKDNEVADGMFIANKTTTINMDKKLQINEDNIFKWGYWASEDALSIAQKDKLFGVFIDNKVDLTTKQEIQNLIDNDTQAEYSVSIFGTVHHHNMQIDTISNGVGNFNIDFGADTIDGSISFKAGSDMWSILIEDGLIKKDSSSFEVTSISNNNADVSVNNYNIKGNFYGEEADYIGGKFNLMGNNGDLAIGGFKGQK